MSPTLPTRRLVLALPLAAMAAAPAGAQRAQPREGEQFTVLKSPRPPADPAKVEVLEFFSYACPHCYEFDPSLEKWRAHLPPDVSFRRVPVPFLYNAANFQRTSFTLEIMGQLGEAHTRLFDAVHKERKPLDTPEAIAAVLGTAGVDRAKFLEVFKSFGMPALLAKAKAATNDYDIDGVPTLAIGGRYLTSPSIAGSVAAALSTADFLIQKARTRS